MILIYTIVLVIVVLQKQMICLIQESRISCEISYGIIHHKLQLMQKFVLHDFETGHRSSLQFFACLEFGSKWLWNIFWIDESQFYLGSSMNTHNCRISESENTCLISQFSISATKNNNVVWVYCILHSWPTFLRRIKC